MLSSTTGQTDAAIREIASDNQSGAAEILRRAAALFSLLRDELNHQALSVKDAQRSVCNTCIALANAQPDMSSLLRLASEVLSAARTQTAVPMALKLAADAAHEFVQSATDSAHATATHAVNLIRDGSKVLTHSRSSTVVEALIEARRVGKHFEVIATESRPMLEGRRLASELSCKGINVTLIADSAASLIIERADVIADAVMLGADKITPENLVNKIGTRMIALAARERGLPIYAICDTSKFIAADYLADVIREQRNTGELWLDPPEGVFLMNSYFEPTPLAYFTGVVTECGALSDSEASTRASEAGIDPVLIDALQNPRREIR